MGGYELAMRGREHIAYIGVFSDNEGKPESDGSAIGCPGSDRPYDPLRGPRCFTNIAASSTSRELPPADFAPVSLIGSNWKGGNYPARQTPVAADLRDIALTLDPLSASMAPGARVGVIDVVHSTEREVIELEITGDTANVAGVSARSGTKLIRRGLVVGISKLASGATYTVTITARLRSDPKISIQKSFQIAVP